MIDSNTGKMFSQDNLPLKGIKVTEFTHMIMGPAVGAILADLGAEVIRIEPVTGDKTRLLPGSGIGFFTSFNRNKRSIALDIKSDQGKDIALKLIQESDVLIENFRPGTMERLGFGYEDLKPLNNRLIYCSAKGFLQGPYENRTALDEIAQMMGGLAHMTGPIGQPLRAGSSVIDIMGGMFGVIGILAACEQLKTTGRGQKITSALFENVAYLMTQHMAQYAITGEAVPPMPVRKSVWAIYEVFQTKGDEQVFVGVVSDAQWQSFCKAFDLLELLENSDLNENAGRVEHRDLIIPIITETFKQYTKLELMQKLEETGLPFAPISKPEDLFEDPHLNASDGLVAIDLPEGGQVKLPTLPIEMDGNRFGVRYQPSQPGEHTREILRELDFDDEIIDQMVNESVVSE
ncbi:MAG TPA: CaiB/BaiF CoA-transferase family protein [Gammaproteobacteria bacterium]|jgi:crotonobetainyl-CoA:carnitine CoA-transferase CaiB-like acyl-CoA transferase|nr:CaiB/BaiF CoA-transferase family protein [Gammaproteobacteria bacterium]|tara:strand:- start:5428 stop:6639 length:1212 start_codon:yes stop_codon:yes gene_type:complete